MKGLLADVNIQGIVDDLSEWFQSEDWNYYWTELGIDYFHFSDFGLDPEEHDDVIWRLCQKEGLFLITDNRNNDGPRSLEQTILNENRPERLPVLTVSNKQKLRQNRTYAWKVLESLFTVLIEIDDYRGAGRVFLPLPKFLQSDAPSPG